MEPEHSQGRVHIVDDDASLRVAMGRSLTQAGYTVTTCATAQHLLDNLPTGNEPGCIILDIRLPETWTALPCSGDWANSAPRCLSSS